MELAEIFKAIRARKLLALTVVAVAIAAAAAIKVTSHSVDTGAATAQVIVDSPQSVLADLQQDPTPLATRASVFAQVMASSVVLDSIAHATGIPASEITAQGPFSGSGLALNVVTPSEARGVQLSAQGVPYRLTFVAQTTLPIITISAQAPTPAAAARLANAVSVGTNQFVQSLQQQTQTKGSKRVTIRELGPAQASTVNSSSALVMMAAATVAILVLGLVAILLLEARARRARRIRIEQEFGDQFEDEFGDQPEIYPDPVAP
jgi:capsular polysaccharide biosynthesis protein